MAVVSRVEPIADWLKIAVDETLTPKARSAAVAGFARDQAKVAEEKNRQALGRVPRRKTFVDGRAEAPLESVNPERGKIVFEFDLLTDVLRWIAETLVARSPVKKGDYVRGHKLFAGGQQVALTATEVPPADEYVFLNMVPYARKLEIGKTKSGRAFLVQVENRIYQRTAADARRRFGNIAAIKFAYRSPVISYQPAGSRLGSMSARGGRERRTRAPAIIISLRG